MQSFGKIEQSERINPIVATYGCGPCIAMGGWDPNNNTAFVVHFANAGEVREAGGRIAWNIRQLGNNPIVKPIQLHLRGGREGCSEKLREAIMTWAQHGTSLPITIVSDTTLTEDVSSLSIDARTGNTSAYDPLSNAKHREFTELDVLRALNSAYQPHIHIAYKPQ